MVFLYLSHCPICLYWLFPVLASCILNPLTLWHSFCFMPADAICVLMGSKFIVSPIKERKKEKKNPQIHDKSLKQHPKLCPMSSHYNHIYSVLHISMNRNPTLPNTRPFGYQAGPLKLNFNTHKSC